MADFWYTTKSGERKKKNLLQFMYGLSLEDIEDESSTAPKQSYWERVVDEIDNFPYVQEHPAVYKHFLKFYYRFYVTGVEKPIGFIPANVAEEISKLDFWGEDPSGEPLKLNYWKRDASKMKLILHGEGYTERTERLESTLDQLYENAGAEEGSPFISLLQMQVKPTPIYSHDMKRLFELEDTASQIFGVTAHFVTVIAWTTLEDGRHYWVKAYPGPEGGPGMLGNLTSNPLIAHFTPLLTESNFKACLEIRSRAKRLYHQKIAGIN